MIERLKSLTNIMEKRSTFYDRGMRHLADERKKRPSEDYGSRADGEQEGKRPKHKRKKPDTLAPQETNIGKFFHQKPEACAWWQTAVTGRNWQKLATSLNSGSH
jgi:hypothetical protein